MLLIDLQEGRLIDDDEVKTLLSTAKPYMKKIKDSRFCLSDLTLKTEDFPLPIFPVIPKVIIII